MSKTNDCLVHDEPIAGAGHSVDHATMSLQMGGDVAGEIGAYLPGEVPDLFLLEGSTVEITIAQASAIVYRAAQLVLLHRAGRSIDDAMNKLDDTLTHTAVIDIEF